ncbi:MAG: alpha/beta fold hydrolase [Myxococcales bacterium FL481]|nr:MAG: alpha/beta fold hydrolase [Myxococcales bacterium FL481]
MPNDTRSSRPRQPTTPPVSCHELGLTTRRMSLPAGEVRFVDEGQGQPVVLLHGAPVTSLGFLRVIRELRKHHRVIAPDLPGFGASTAAPSFTGDLTSYAEFVVMFCQQLDLRNLVLYVNDASGCFGLHAAGNMRDRVAGVVVADTVPVPLTGRAWPVRLVLRYLVCSGFVRALNRRFNALPWLVATVAPFLQPFSARERRVLLEQFDTHEKRDRVLDLFAHMAQDVSFMQATAALVRDALRLTPALLLYGQLDPMRFVGSVGRFRDLLPCSQTEIIPFEEHFPILASGERVGRAVATWIAQRAAA